MASASLERSSGIAAGEALPWPGERCPPLASTSTPSSSPPPSMASRPAPRAARRLHRLHRFPIDGVQTRDEPVKSSARRTSSMASPSPSSAPPTRSSPQPAAASSASLSGAEGGSQPPVNASFGPAALLLGAARAVATAVGDASGGGSANPPTLPDPALLSPAEMKALKSARAASLANVDWRDVAWVKQRYFYTGNAYQQEEPQSQQRQQQQCGSAPASPSSSPHPVAPSPSTRVANWLTSYVDGGMRSKASSTLEPREALRPQAPKELAFTPHTTGTLLWIVYGKVKHQRVPVMPAPSATAAAAAGSSCPSSSSLSPSPSATATAHSFISPAVIPQSLCPVEELMPGCLSCQPSAQHAEVASAAATAREETDPYVVFSVSIYEGGFAHGAFHGSGRLTVFQRYVLECQWCDGVPQLTERCYGGSPCVLRSIVSHHATSLPEKRGRQCRAADAAGREGPLPASAFISFRKHSLGYALWPAAADGVSDTEEAEERGGGGGADGTYSAPSPPPAPRFLSTVTFGNQYMGSLTVAMTVAATTSAIRAVSNLFSLPPQQPSPPAGSAAAPRAAPAANPVEDVLLSHWRATGKLFWTELMSFAPDGFGEMAFYTAEAASVRPIVSSGTSGAVPGSCAAKPVEGVLTGRYYGGWRSGRRHGFGAEWSRTTGSLYIGVYSRDVRSGTGSLEVDATGAVFCGTWLNGEIQPPVNVALSLSPAFSLQGAQWHPSGAKASAAHTAQRAATNPEPTSARPFFGFHQGTLLRSRHSLSGLWEPVFAELDAALAAMPPVADELLHFSEKGKRNSMSASPAVTSSRSASADTGEAAAAAPREPVVVSRQLDPIVLAVTACPAWRAALATFQRTFYFLYARCPGGRDAATGAHPQDAAAAAEKGTTTAPLLARLKARGRQTATASAALAEARDCKEPEARRWSTPSWCSLVGLHTERVRACLQSSEAGAVPEVHTADFLPAKAAEGDGSGADAFMSTEDNAGREPHASRPCLHTLLSPSSTDRNRVAIDTCSSLAQQRGLTPGRAFALAMHAAASFVSSLRLRLVSYIAAHPAACDVTDHQVALLRYCWDVVYAAVAPLLHALAGDMVAHGTRASPHGSTSVGGDGKTDAAADPLLTMLGGLGGSAHRSGTAAAAFHTFATATEGGLGELHATMAKAAMRATHGALTAEEEALAKTCFTLFCCPTLSRETCCVRATTHGPLLSLSCAPRSAHGGCEQGRAEAEETESSPFDNDAVAPASALIQTSLGAALDALTALVHQTLSQNPASPLWQEQRLARCLAWAAGNKNASATGRSPGRCWEAADESHQEQGLQEYFRAVGLNPVATLVLLHSATSGVAPAFPIPDITKALSQEMEALHAMQRGDDVTPYRAGNKTPQHATRSTKLAPALEAVAQALVRIYHSRLQPAGTLPGASCPSAAEAPPLHELATRALFCLTHCGSQWCLRRCLPATPPPSFTIGADAQHQDGPRQSGRPVANSATSVTLSSEMDHLRAHLPAGDAFARVRQCLREALSLNASGMAWELARFWSSCDPHRRGGGAGESLSSDHMPSAGAIDAPRQPLFTDKRGHNARTAHHPRQRQHRGQGTRGETPELLEWILSSVHELFLPSKASERQAPPPQAAQTHTWRTYLHGSPPPHMQYSPQQLHSPPPPSYPPLLSEETFWYVQLLTVFVHDAFGIDLRVQVSFGFGGDDEDEDEEEEEKEEEGGESAAFVRQGRHARRKTSQGRFTLSASSSSSSSSSSPASARPSHSPSPSPAQPVGKADESRGPVAAVELTLRHGAPVKASQAKSDGDVRNTAGVTLSPTPDPNEADGGKIDLSASDATCTPRRSALPTVAQEPRTRSVGGPIVGRAVTLTVTVPEGFMGGLGGELLADRWTTAVARMASATSR